MHLFSHEAKVPSLELKTFPKQFSGILLIDIALPNPIECHVFDTNAGKQLSQTATDV